MRTISKVSGLLCAATVAQALREHAAVRKSVAMPDAGADVRPLSDGGTRFVEIEDGIGLQVAERGSGRSVVFLHGWGMSLDAWSYLPRLLPPDVRMIAVDLRGHGGSSPVPPGGDLDLLARDIARLLEVLEIEDALVVGHSLGGIVAQALAVRHQDVVAKRVRGLLLVSTTARGALSSARSRVLASVLSSPVFARMSSSPLLGLVLARHAFASVVPASRLCMMRDMGKHAPVERRRGFDLFALGDLLPELWRIAVPVTVLSGVEDPATPVREAVVLANGLSGSRLRLLVDTAHLVPLERPEAVAEEICRMLKANPLGGARD